MKIIINSDDFGLNTSVNMAIAEAFDRKLITDTTMLANGSAFDQAVQLANEKHFSKHLGIHFNLTEGEPLTDKIKNCKKFVTNGLFLKYNRMIPLNRYEREAVYEELSAQITKLETAEICITHADSHHHIHTGLFVAPIVLRVCKEHNINKIRLHRNIGKIEKYKLILKSKYNLWLKNRGFITTDYFGLAEDVISKGSFGGTVEIMVHAGYDTTGVLIDITRWDEDKAYGKSLEEVIKGLAIKPNMDYHSL